MSKKNNELIKKKKKRKKKRTRPKNTNNKNNIKQNNKINKNKTQKKSAIKKTKKFNNTYFQILILIIFIIIVITTTFFIIKNNIKFNLIGPNNQNIEVFSTYHEPGYKATIFNKNINNKVKTTSTLNTNILGTYQITYKLELLTTKKITRTINVVDTEPPTITLNGNKNITIYTNDKYNDLGVTIKDNYDNDLSKNLTIENNLNTKKAGTYTITYTVYDSSNNKNSITRTITVKNKQIITSRNTSCNIANPIENYICKNNYDISIGYYNLNTNKTYYYRQNKLYYGASLIKTLDALYLYDNNLINNDLKEHVKKIITISDNASHHYLVNYIGKQKLKNYGISLGASNTLYGTDNFGSTSVKDQIAYMKKLYNLTKDNQNEELKSFFTNTRKNYLIFENSPTILHKYGHWQHVYHNAGIVLDENPYIVVILTNEGYDNYQNIIKTLSKLIYEYHKTNN